MPPVIASEARGLRGQIASAVAIVIALADGVPYAATVGSFAVVSCEPALATVYLARGSRTHEAACRCDRFSVSVLDRAADQMAGRLARPARRQGWAGLAGVDLVRLTAL